MPPARFTDANSLRRAERPRIWALSRQHAAARRFKTRSAQTRARIGAAKRIGARQAGQSPPAVGIAAFARRTLAKAPEADGQRPPQALPGYSAQRLSLCSRRRTAYCLTHAPGIAQSASPPRHKPSSSSSGASNDAAHSRSCSGAMVNTGSRSDRRLRAAARAISSSSGASMKCTRQAQPSARA